MQVRENQSLNVFYDRIKNNELMKTSWEWFLKILLFVVDGAFDSFPHWNDIFWAMNKDNNFKKWRKIRQKRNLETGLWPRTQLQLHLGEVADLTDNIFPSKRIIPHCHRLPTPVGAPPETIKSVLKRLLWVPIAKACIGKIGSFQKTSENQSHFKSQLFPPHQCALFILITMKCSCAKTATNQDK